MFGQAQNVCKYEKFGFCKEGDSCPRFHPKVLCDKDSCDVTSCNKRHPMVCRNFIKGDCRFGSACKFDHRKQKNIKALEDKTDTLVKEVKDLKSRLNDQDATIKTLRQMIEQLQQGYQNMNLKFTNQENTVNVLKENLEATEENLVGLMRHMHEESEQCESTPAKKRKKANFKDLDSEAETTMGDEVSVMELDESALNDLEYAEKMQTDDPSSDYTANLVVGKVVCEVRAMLKKLNTRKINETYEKIQDIKNIIDEENAGEGMIHKDYIENLKNITNHLNNHFTKINPRDKKNFRKNVKEMCEQIIKDEDQVVSKMTKRKHA